MTPDRLSALHAAAFPDTRSWSAKEFSDLLESKLTCFVNRGDSFALGRVVGPEAELLTIAVPPLSQGKGLGRAILGQLEDAFKSRGVTEVFLEVSERNLRAINLYRSEGYVDISRRESYYTHADGSRSDCLNMSKRI